MRIADCGMRNKHIICWSLWYFSLAALAKIFGLGQLNRQAKIFRTPSSNCNSPKIGNLQIPLR